MIHKCLICGAEVGWYTRHVKSHGISPRDYYHKYVIKSDEIPKCETCGKELEFNSLAQPYYKTCDINCKFRSPVLSRRFSAMVSANNKTEGHKEYNRRSIHYALAASDKKKYTESDIGYFYIVLFSNRPCIKIGYSIDPFGRFYRYRKSGLSILGYRLVELKVHSAIDLELEMKLKFYNNRYHIEDSGIFDYQIGYSEFFDYRIFNDLITSIDAWLDLHA